MTSLPVTYTQKLHAFAPEKTWTIEPDGVRWEDHDEDARTRFIPWNKIKSVRIRFEPSRAETRRIAFRIYTPIEHTITNINFAGLMNFELQEKEFRNFVLAFHEAIPNDTDTVFHKGSTKAAWLGNFAITIAVLMLMMFIAPLVSVTGVPGATSIFRIVMIVIFFPLLIKLLIRNRPETYTRDTVPTELLS